MLPAAGGGAWKLSVVKTNPGENNKNKNLHLRRQQLELQELVGNPKVSEVQVWPKKFVDIFLPWDKEKDI